MNEKAGIWQLAKSRPNFFEDRPPDYFSGLIRTFLYMIVEPGS